MCTPVGHSLFGVVLYYTFNTAYIKTFKDIQWRKLGFYVMLSNIPDLDFIPGILVGNANLWHHVISHSLLFLTVMGLLISCFLKLTKEPLNNFLIILFVLFGHTVIDFFTVDTRLPYGIDLFWPMEGYFISPKALFPTFHRDIAMIISIDNLVTLIIESSVFSSALMAVYAILNYKKIKS